jgi:hypothetical protein
MHDTQPRAWLVVDTRTRRQSLHESMTMMMKNNDETSIHNDDNENDNDNDVVQWYEHSGAIGRLCDTARATRSKSYDKFRLPRPEPASFA